MIDGASVKVAELREGFHELATERPKGFLSEYELRRPGEVILTAAQLPVDERYSYRKLEALRVTSIEVDAVLVNLDRDVEPDGFEVYLSVFDQSGEPVEVRGNVYARLWGQRSELHGSPVSV